LLRAAFGRSFPAMSCGMMKPLPVGELPTVYTSLEQPPLGSAGDAGSLK
jgi:hypothetical protein